MVDLLSTSSLLCSEEDVDIFADDDEDCLNHYHSHHHHSVEQRNSNGDLTNFGNEVSWHPLIEPVDDEYLSVLFKREIEQLLDGDDYLTRLWNGELDLVARNDAVEWIRKVQSQFNFGPLTTYLAVNYMDRFLSFTELAKGRVWMMQLVALACLSLATKMEETGGVIPSILDLQMDSSIRFIFEGKTVQRMELLILSTLKWRVQSVTPFSFLDYFLSKICGGDDDDDGVQKNNTSLTPMIKSVLFSQGVCLIESTLKGIEFLEFKPSEIAAAVAIAVVGSAAEEKEREREETLSLIGRDFTDKAISMVDHFFDKKERLIKCVEMMTELLSTLMCCDGGGGINTTTGSNINTTNGGVSSGGDPEPGSPNGVLEASNILSCNNSSSSSITCCCGLTTSTFCRRGRPNLIEDGSAAASKRRKLMLYSVPS